MNHRSPRPRAATRLMTRVAVWLGLLIASATSAQTLPATLLPAPRGPVILSIEGNITRRNSPEGAHFDLEMLKALPQSALTTRSPWHKTPSQFAGPTLTTLLHAVGGEGGKLLKFQALDRYESTVPLDDAARWSPILAWQRDGKPLAKRDLGPLLLIYPFDQHPELQENTYYSRSVWHVRRLVVE